MRPPFKRQPVPDTPLRRRYEAMEELEATRFVAIKLQRVIARVMIALGVVAGCIALLLITNAYGNTDVQGLVLLAIASGILGAGVSLQSHPISKAIGTGILCLPLGPLFAFSLYWMLFMSMVLFGWMQGR